MIPSDTVYLVDRKNGRNLLDIAYFEAFSSLAFLFHCSAI